MVPVCRRLVRQERVIGYRGVHLRHDGAAALLGARDGDAAPSRGQVAPPSDSGRGAGAAAYQGDNRRHAERRCVPDDVVQFPALEERDRERYRDARRRWRRDRRTNAHDDVARIVLLNRRVILVSCAVEDPNRRASAQAENAREMAPLIRRKR